jgi:hypothetical protein
MTPAIKRRDRALMFTTFVSCTAALALVIWIKLRVVTAIPRTAYADPNANSAPADQSGNSTGGNARTH